MQDIIRLRVLLRGTLFFLESHYEGHYSSESLTAREIILMRVLLEGHYSSESFTVMDIILLRVSL